MSCPICLENNTNPIYLRCCHSICYSCLSIIRNHTIIGCPICRQGDEIKYENFFPNTQEYMPNKIRYWYNPDFRNIKGENQDLTNYEKDWIKNNWGIIKDNVNLNDLNEMQKYIIIQGNNILFGILISKDNIIFTDCKILSREGCHYKTSPPTRKLNLNNQSKLYSLRN